MCVSGHKESVIYKFKLGSFCARWCERFFDLECSELSAWQNCRQSLSLSHPLSISLTHILFSHTCGHARPHAHTRICTHSHTHTLTHSHVDLSLAEFGKKSNQRWEKHFVQLFETKAKKILSEPKQSKYVAQKTNLSFKRRVPLSCSNKNIKNDDLEM